MEQAPKVEGASSGTSALSAGVGVLKVGADDTATYGHDTARWERDALATAIRDAAVAAGICRADVALTGPQLLMLCADMAAALTPNAKVSGGGTPSAGLPG